MLAYGYEIEGSPETLANVSENQDFKEKIMDRDFYEIIMKQANGSLMTALENQIQADVGGTRKQANILADHILDILNAHKEFKENLVI